MYKIGIIISMTLMISGCNIFGNKALEEEVKLLKQEQAKIKKQLKETEEKVVRYKTALGNALKTVLGNRMNIGLLVRIIQEFSSILVDTKAEQLDALKRIHAITKKIKENTKAHSSE